MKNAEFKYEYQVETGPSRRIRRNTHGIRMLFLQQGMLIIYCNNNYNNRKKKKKKKKGQIFVSSVSRANGVGAGVVEAGHHHRRFDRAESVAAQGLLSRL